MKLIKIYNRGKVLNKNLYDRLKKLDSIVFPGCDNEFKRNRDWWVALGKGKEIAAYCGCLYSEGVCIFVRAWVHQPYRGKGMQRKMIRERVKAASGCSVAITYVMPSNVHSANNLIKSGFVLYRPAYKWAGNQLYFTKSI